MRTMEPLEKECETSFGPAGILMIVVALMVFLVWLPARAGQPSSQGKVLRLDAKGLDLVLQSDPNLLLIDVSTPEELIDPLGKIPQSRNVPFQELEKNPEQLPRDKTLVLICRSGHRSLKAAGLLAEHGYVVYSVTGGMQAWRKLHALLPPTAEGTQEEPAASGQVPDTGKSSPRGNKDEHVPEIFFDTGMGC